MLSKELKQFILNNYTPYYGDESFLANATERTLALNKKYEDLRKQESAKGGVLDVDVSTVSTITSHKPGYLDKNLELIVGLQTDAPLKRGLNVFGGLRMAKQAAEAYGYKLDSKIYDYFKYRTTHNDGVFKAYTKTIRCLRTNHLLTGLPDAYGRGRIIGDYRRVAYFGIDRLIEEKQKDVDSIDENCTDFSEEIIRHLEELHDQIAALKDLATLGDMYGIDLRKPASTAKEAIQAIYMAYLAAVKEQNGAAMSLGRTATFIDIYIENDIKKGILTEAQAQELIDDYILHLRMTRQLRTPEYNELFAGDPTWVTESLGGMTKDGKTLVTKTCFRILHTLDTLGHAPEPNLTILWSKNLPEGWKRYCAKMSIKTDSIQYENDDLMRERFGDDYAIACCVSAMDVGKDMQFFGARCNLPKLLLLAINKGKEEIHGTQILPESFLKTIKFEEPVDSDGYLIYDNIVKNFKTLIKWLANQYVKTMNIIHFMHDKYAYEAIQMALHDSDIKNRWMAFGIAGMSVVADSLSAIKHKKVKAYKAENSEIYSYSLTDNDFPKFGNDDNGVDLIAKDVVEYFYHSLTETPCYRNAKHTLSLLTITSNVMYGKNTGETPDGRKAGEPFAPGANPMHGRDDSGALFSLNSVAKFNYDCCRDGISNTFTINPSALGKDLDSQTKVLVKVLDGYFSQNAHHLNVNVFNTSLLKDAQIHPDRYPNLTIRVSGYAVKFNSLTKAQQDEVIARTCHSSLI